MQEQAENKTGRKGACMLPDISHGRNTLQSDREKWKEEIMRLLEIDIKYYKSKYKAPVPRTDLPSDSNQEFAKEMQSIFR